MRKQRRTPINLSDTQLQEAIQDGAFDQGVRIPTFLEFDGAVRRQWARSRGLDMLDSYKIATDEALRGDYCRYIVGRFVLGAFVGPRMWRVLDSTSKQELLKVSRRLQSSYPRTARQ